MLRSKFSHFNFAEKEILAWTFKTLLLSVVNKHLTATGAPG